MNISDKGISLIKKYEGCRLTAYKCPAGVLTIGYGHTGNDVKVGLKISQQKADSLLKDDLKSRCASVSKLIKVQVNQNQFDALVSLEYNIGYGNFSRSTLLKLLNKGDYVSASKQFLLWKRSNGKVLAGLVKRRNEEQKLFNS